MRSPLRFLVLVSAGALLSAPVLTAAETDPLFQTTFLGAYDFATGKVVQLAEAFSEEQYNWRPGEGVRSTKEALMHIAAANYMLASMLGAPVPEGVKPREFEKSITTKTAAIDVLKKSIAHAREAVAKLPADALDDEINLFGRQAPKMRVVLLVGEHANEHLGQLIAYARSNGVKPPWSN